MRLYVRTSRRTGVSLGPAALLVLLPFLVAVWTVYAAALLVYGVGWLAVQGIEALGDRAERQHIGRRSDVR